MTEEERHLAILRGIHPEGGSEFVSRDRIVLPAMRLAASEAREAENERCAKIGFMPSNLQAWFDNHMEGKHRLSDRIKTLEAALECARPEIEWQSSNANNGSPRKIKLLRVLAQIDAAIRAKAQDEKPKPEPEPVETRHATCGICGLIAQECQGDHGWTMRKGLFAEPAPLVIEEGKFYRNRRGEKRGPMRRTKPPHVLPWSDGETTYFADGTWCSGKNDLDLIAEWEDEKPEPAPSICPTCGNGARPIPCPDCNPKAAEPPTATRDWRDVKLSEFTAVELQEIIRSAAAGHHLNATAEVERLARARAGGGE